MKKIVISVLGLFLVACSASKNTGESYGQEISLAKQTKISEILEKPEKFVGKNVLVSGEVLEVCSMKGCWIDLAGEMAGQRIRVKVEDDVIVFPETAKGQKAVVEGRVEEIKLTKEEAIEWKRHQAEERGEEFDPSSVTDDETIYRIWGLGAVIEIGA